MRYFTDMSVLVKMSVFRENQHDSSIRDLVHFQQLMPVKILPFLWTPAKALENRLQVWFPGVYLPGMNPIEVREVRVSTQPAQRKTCDWYFLCLSAILVCMIVLVTTVVITIILGNNNPDARITTGPTRPFINPTTSASHKSTTSTIRPLSTTNSSSGDTNDNWTSTKANNISSSSTAEPLTTNNTLKSTPHSSDSVATSSVKTTALVTDGVKKSPNHKPIRTTTSRALILHN